MLPQSHVTVLQHLTWTFDIHKVRVRTLYKALLLVPPPRLLWRWVQQVFRELTGRTQVIGNHIIKGVVGLW